MFIKSSSEIEPEDRVIITVDAREDFWQFRHMAHDLGARARAFKLGQRLLLHDNPWAIVSMLRRVGADVSLDAKYEEDADQMGPIISDAFKKGFDHISVAPTSGSRALVAAGESTPTNGRLFAALPSYSGQTEQLLEEVVEANHNLSPEKQIQDVMCNVGDIERVKNMGDFTVIATGIRLPGDAPNDHPLTATPAEAIALGADLLAVGRAITAKPDRTIAFEQVLENIATYQ